MTLSPPLGNLLVLVLAFGAAWASADDLGPFTFDDGQGRVYAQERLRAEFWDNGYATRLDSDTGDEYIGYHRLYLGLNWQPLEVLGFGLELRDSRTHNGPDVLYADGDQTNAFIADDPLDISQAWGKLSAPGELQLDLTLGRQYWVIGDQRLVGGLKWTNNARGFDGVKLDTRIGELPVTVLHGRHVNQFNQAHINDVWDSGYDYLSGVVVGHELFGTPGSLVYTLYSDRKSPTLRDTLTVGALSKWQSGSFAFSNELALQGGDSHQAYAFSLRGTYAIQDAPADPSIGIELNYGSGDDDLTDGSSRTFDNLYPTNHAHYGMMDFASWRNAMNAGLLTTVHPHEKLTTRLDVWALGLAESEDHWYAASGAPVGSASARDNGSHYLGTEIDFINTIRVCRNLTVEVAFGYFFSGSATKGRSTGDDSAFTYVEGSLTF